MPSWFLLVVLILIGILWAPWIVKMSFHKFWKIVGRYPLLYFFCSFLSSPPGTLITCMSDGLLLCHRYQMLCSFFCCFISFCFFLDTSYLHVSKSQILFSAVASQLITPQNKFITSNSLHFIFSFSIFLYSQFPSQCWNSISIHACYSPFHYIFWKYVSWLF